MGKLMSIHGILEKEIQEEYTPTAAMYILVYIQYISKGLPIQ